MWKEKKEGRERKGKGMGRGKEGKRDGKEKGREGKRDRKKKGREGGRSVMEPSFLSLICHVLQVASWEAESEM